MINTNKLYSKFTVTRKGKSLDKGSFVLTPFRPDGTVLDQAAVYALTMYAGSCGIPDLKEAINDWLANPTKYNWMNVSEGEQVN